MLTSFVRGAKSKLARICLGASVAKLNAVDDRRNYRGEFGYKAKVALLSLCVFGVVSLSGCGYNRLQGGVDLKKELRRTGKLGNKTGKEVFEYYFSLEKELKEKQSSGELSKDMNVIDYYRLKQKQSQYEQEFKAREDALKAQESKKSY